MGFRRRMSKSRFFTIVVSFTLFSVVILWIHKQQEVKSVGPFNRISSFLRPRRKTPGGQSYCKLNYGLPTELVYSGDDLSGSPELGQESPFRVLYNVIEGQRGLDEPSVTYATHLTKDYLMYLPEIVRYWEGPISLAVYIKDGNPTLILEQILHFCYCIPDMSRVSLHFVFRKEFELTYYLGKQMSPVNCGLQNSDQSINSGNITYIVKEISDTNTALDGNWYPINVCRNVARNAVYTDFMLVCDIELMPSQGLASRFVDMIENYKCANSDCNKRVFVVPIFEVESTEDVPRTKSQLLRLMNENKSVYFHQMTCVSCQRFPGLDEWKKTDPGNVITPLLETKREIPFNGWEPIYIGTKNEPLYLEQLSWEGYLDKMLQMVEMCMAGYKLVILDGAFLVHWPGIKRTTQKEEPWRLPYAEINKGIYNGLVKNLSEKYPANPNCGAKEL